MRRFFLLTTFLCFLLLSAGGVFLSAQTVQAQVGSGGNWTGLLNAPRFANPLQAGTTAPVIQPVITATPNPDGSLIHEVQSGQSLWSIATAYGVSIAQIQQLNNLDQNAVLLPGQKLILRPAFTPTISPTPSLTPIPPTRTPSLTPTPVTPTLTYTQSPTLTETPAPLIEIDWQPPAWFNQTTFGLGLILISGAGLVFVLFSAFRRK